ncbi:subtilase family protein [Geodermatophilus normandii]|uniref:Subtilase family protein n=1 Tax=Geodermatophilus normandii TaxID=1137989 RepID=A0A317QQE9_9ACTN|nr:S8 family peptidase [Geodermatophilus normandii]PWW25061.1 subtilase family protein [Geodermatophilus normandii]
MTEPPRWDGVPQFPSEYGPVRDPADEYVPGTPGARTWQVPTSPELVLDSVVSKPLRELMGGGGGPIGVMVELRTRYEGGIPAARARVTQLLGEVAGVREDEIAVNGSYLTVTLRAPAIEELVRYDAGPVESPDEQGRAPRGAIHRLWPNFQTSALIYRSIVTTKCQAAQRSFRATGRGLVWAVLDSGIQGDHPHFATHHNLDGLPHKSFVDADDKMALVDEAGHGTHVAGILAGEMVAPDGGSITATTWYRDSGGTVQPSALRLPSIAGMAPECRLLSCQVLRPDESGDITGLIAALQYVNTLNDNGRDLVVHGVNVSVGHPFDPTWFATGLTPVCREVDRLVRSGVVVVVAAGNSGYGYARDPQNNVFRLGFDMTINDPGNAALALTVGSTSCSPHQNGVSYFSSKGPTGDGRMKPDLIAPGERVVSAAAGKLAVRAREALPGSMYIENSGTSMAAPHVSGVAAGFLSVHPEFIGHPEQVRTALMDTATDIGRSRHFQGAGLVDAMRAIQSV